MALKKKSSELIDWNPELGCWEGTDRFGDFIRQWCDENEYLHRERGPAWIGYHKNGIPSGELWFLHGRLHRAGAPAWIRYHKNGTPSKGGWYLHGEEATPLYSDKILEELFEITGIEGFRKLGSSFLFLVILCPDPDSLFK